MKLSELIKRLQNQMETYGDYSIRKFSITDEAGTSTFTRINEETSKPLTVKEFRIECEREGGLHKDSVV